jgi:ElaB/YqjD/DUF883 family membrane-anchored ribosome-binding protein
MFNENNESKTEAAANAAVEDLRALVRDAEEVLANAGEEAGEEIAELRQRLRAAIRDHQPNLQELRRQAREQFDRCDEYVQSHPYHSLGIAAAIGAVLGVLLIRRA